MRKEKLVIIILLVLVLFLTLTEKSALDHVYPLFVPTPPPPQYHTCPPCISNNTSPVTITTATIMKQTTTQTGRINPIDELVIDSVANMFTVNEYTADIEDEIDEMHKGYPTNKPRACAFILAFPVNCGFECEAPLSTPGCTQVIAVTRVVSSLQKYLLGPYDYPMVIFEPDWTAEQKLSVELATKAKIFWHRITFDENTLPNYLDKNSVLPMFRAANTDGKLSIPHRSLHSYGYRNMCRFFGGLIFHAPVMRKFDYYLRVDGGDSRVNNVSCDVFVKMQKNDKKYGFVSMAFFDASESMSYFHDVNNRFLTGRGLKYNPDFNIPERYAGEQYYNNFEVVDMRTFRTSIHYDYFRTMDEEALFLCPNNVKHERTCRFSNNAMGDADFRTLAVALFLKKSDVINLSAFVEYSHPVPSWCVD